jgi:preprotein translocase SecE subunit
MAVAVKNPPVAGATKPLDRLPVVSLLGALYVLGTLWVVFLAVPQLWYTLTGFQPENLAGFALLTMIAAAVAAGLGYLGYRLLHAREHPPGARAGIFVVAVGLVLVLILTRWASLWLEYWVYFRYWLGDNGATAGLALTGAVFVGLVALGVWLFLRPKTVAFLKKFEEQDWFSAHSYKPLQGQRVRRATILGLLIIAGTGVWTLRENGPMRNAPENWVMNAPFSGSTIITSIGDAALVMSPEQQAKVEAGGLTADPVTLRTINDRLASEYVRVTDPKLAGTFDEKVRFGAVLKKSEFDEAARKTKEAGRDAPVAVPPTPASGPTTYQSFTLLPALPYTVPLLVLGLSVWGAWRIVNLPVFADFLIATEAELNKVSWTTRPRLIQDTIVVLVTVLLMATYLFLMDQTWRIVLSMEPIHVLQFQDESADKNKSAEEKPY